MGKQESIKRAPLIDTSKVPDPVLGNKPITGERYYSKEFMEREWEQLWTKTWHIAGLEDELKKPGDFLTTEIGWESVICIRGDDEKIRAFYNVCPHRGNRLIDDAKGSQPNLTCRYHGWRFGLEGDLKFAPCTEDFPQGNPCGKVGMTEVPCEIWSSFIWFSLDENVKPLEEHLGPLKSQIETYQMEQMKRIHWVTIEGDFNWKIPQDNFNESYHLPYVHPQTKYVLEPSYRYCQFDMYDGYGHTRMFMPGGRPAMGLKGEVDQTLQMMKPELEFWDLNPEDFRDDPHGMRAALQNAKRTKDKEKGFDYSGFVDDQLTDHYHYILFPNVSLSLKPDGAIFTRSRPHPTDPNKCFFDFGFFMWFPKGNDRYYCNTMAQWFDADFEPPHIQGKFPEVSCGEAIDQDVAVWESQHAGLRSQGFKREYLSAQEHRIRFWHESLDRVLGLD